MSEAAQATDPKELERQIMSATEPKNEREWWAKREIEQLREVLAEHDALVRRLDVALNGDGAAPQASLCDLVSQYERNTVQEPPARWHARRPTPI